MIPLSPFLFLFMVDSLSSLIQEAVMRSMVIYRTAPVITHLLSADDRLLFFKASEEQASMVKGILDRYTSATGQLINEAKCSMMFANLCSHERKQGIKEVLGVVSEEFEDRYLGLPVPGGR